MKVILLKTNLKEGLSAVERGVTESNSLPVLKNILIKTFNNRIRIDSTNLEIGISRFVSGKIIENGSVTVPFHVLLGIVNNLDAERINLETDGNNLLIKTDNYEAKIQGISPEEFPIIPKISNLDYYLEINSDFLKKYISKVITCCQISEIRPEISGIMFDFQMTVLKLAATDSFRLAEASIFSNHFKTNFIRGFKVVVPMKTAQEIMRIFGDNQNITIHVDPNQILFKNEDSELISRLIEGEYPDYDQIVPKELKTELTINKNNFTNALKLVSNFSGRINEIKIKLKDGKKVLDVYSSSQYLGENNYLVPVKSKGEDFSEVKFNWRFLIDGLKTLETDNVLFGINGDSKPSLIKSPEDTSYFYILMPIKNGG